MNLNGKSNGSFGEAVKNRRGVSPRVLFTTFLRKQSDLAHKSDDLAGRSVFRERPNDMLFPAILQILDQSQIQSKKAVKNVESGFEAEMTAAMEEISGAEKIELSVANASDPAGPLLNPDTHVPEKPAARQSLEELLRIITKFQKSNQQPVVDFFE